MEDSCVDQANFALGNSGTPRCIACSVSRLGFPSEPVLHFGPEAAPPTRVGVPGEVACGLDLSSEPNGVPVDGSLPCFAEGTSFSVRRRQKLV